MEEVTVNLNPGSDEAVKQGCTCPRMDNGYGKGCAELPEGQFWITSGCVVHDPPTKAAERPFSVWRFTDAQGRRYWVAGKNYDEAMNYLLEKRTHTSFPDHGVLVTDFNEGGFAYGDPEDDGEAPITCTLGELVDLVYYPAESLPVLIGEDSW